MTFEIKHIETEKRIDGRTRIFAVANDEEKTDLSVSYSNLEYVDLNKKSIGIMLNKSYMETLRARVTQQEIIKIGDIVGGE